MVADVAAVAVFGVDDDGLCVRAHIQRLHAAARVGAEHLAALRVAVADGGRLLVHVAGVVEHLVDAALVLAVNEDPARLGLADLAADAELDDLLGHVADTQAHLVRRGCLGCMPSLRRMLRQKQCMTLMGASSGRLSRYASSW